MQTQYIHPKTIVASSDTFFEDYNEDQISVAVNLVSRYIDTFLGFILASDISNDLVDWLEDGSGTEYLVLSQPLNRYTSVNRVALDDSLTEILYSRSYPLNAPYTTSLALRVGRFPAGNGNIVFVGAFMGMFTVSWDGHSGEPVVGEHTLPTDVTDVALALVRAFLENDSSIEADESSKEAGAKVSETIGSWSASYSNDVTKVSKAISSVPTATDILERYKIINIA